MTDKGIKSDNQLRPFVGFTEPTQNALYEFIANEKRMLVKVYRGVHAQKRRDRERDAIKLWQAASFKTSLVFDIEVNEITEPYLVISFVEFPSLRQLLRENELTIDEKLAIIEKLFVELNSRHTIALGYSQHLIHYDPSTDNVLCGDDGFVFIDLETLIPAGQSQLDSVSIEVATTCRWIVRDLGIEHIQAVMKLVVKAYGVSQPEILVRIIKRTLGRPFQFFHRYKDRRKKEANRLEVTKYDIADALKEEMG